MNHEYLLFYFLCRGGQSQDQARGAVSAYRAHVFQLAETRLADSDRGAPPDRCEEYREGWADGTARVRAQLTAMAQEQPDPLTEDGLLRLLREGGQSPQQAQAVASACKAYVFELAECVLIELDLGAASWREREYQQGWAAGVKAVCGQLTAMAQELYDALAEDGYLV